MPTIAGLATASPDHVLRQDDVARLAQSILPDTTATHRLLDVFANAQIDKRHLAAPVDWYLEPHGFADRNALFTRVGERLAAAAVTRAAADAGIEPSAVDGIVYVSTTGIATPSLDARLADRLALRPDAIRVPMWGLGCAGGVAGLARTADLARAHPARTFALVALELCSLSFDIARVLAMADEDAAPRTAGEGKKAVVAASLFADGCAAAIVQGDEVDAPAGLRVGAATSHLFPGTQRVMGWDVEDDHLEVVLSPEIPTIVARELAGIVRPFFDEHLGKGATVDEWVLHPGGARVLDAYRLALGLPEGAVRHGAWVLREHGNMSSPSVLYALGHARRSGALGPGRTAALAAMGPGFAADLLLLEAA